jgi:hypothetical protein
MRSESIWRKRAGPGRLSSHFTEGEVGLNCDSLNSQKGVYFIIIKILISRKRVSPEPTKTAGSLLVRMIALKITKISNLIKNPLPPTHPPLRLRIYKILRESGKTHQKVGES